MVQTERLRYAMAEKGLDCSAVAWHLGISPGCFQRKLESGRFGSAEMQDLADLLELRDPEGIFFA